MISLTYLSSSTVPVDAADLEEILAVSRRNNTAAGLTGMLLYADGHFIQTLEGEPEVVAEAFARIAGDPRHRDVLVALREEVAERAFPDWSMGFDRLTPEEAATIPGATDYLEDGSARYRDTAALGRAGVFHRIFRDRMRVPASRAAGVPGGR
jgi:hypothetical protein